MRQTLRVAALAILMAGALAACHPTGHPRCDAYPAPKVHIERNGWHLNCNPPFDGTNDGTQANPLGWASKKDRTVYIWPNHIGSDRRLHKIMWHEAGHTYGYDEWTSELFAFCHMTAAERDGVGFMAPYPQQWQCSSVA